MATLTSVILFLLLLHCSQGTDCLSDYFTAAVFEHSRQGKATDTPQEILSMNLRYYETATRAAKFKGADLIVFPEYGLLPLLTREEMKPVVDEVPDPQFETVNPCAQFKEFESRLLLRNLSCLAKNYNIILLANIIDRQPCDHDAESHKCPEDGAFYFNSNVVFGKDGTILFRYYKENLFYEPCLDAPIKPQNPVFVTSVGTFATFICFDIIFKHIVNVAQDERVSAILFTTMWFNEPPLLNSIQYWQAWSKANNISLVVSNRHRPVTGTFGSGIFTPHMGALGYTFSPDCLSKLVVSRVPRWRTEKFLFSNPESSTTVITSNDFQPFNEREDGRDMPMLCSRNITEGNAQVEDFNLTVGCLHENTMNYTFVHLTKLQDSLNICNNGMCCSLNYTMDSIEDTYYLGVHNGSFLTGNYFWCVENCIVVRCNQLLNNVCGSFPMSSKTIFRSLSLKANFSTPHIYPSIIKSGVKPAPLNEWTYGVSNSGSAFVGHVSYFSVVEKPLLVAGLHGRCYSRDLCL